MPLHVAWRWKKINTFVGLFLFILKLSRLSGGTLDSPQRERKIKASRVRECGDMVPKWPVAWEWHWDGWQRASSGERAGYFLNSLVSTQTLLLHYSVWRSMRSASLGFGTNDGPEQPCDRVGFWRNIAGSLHYVLTVCTDLRMPSWPICPAQKRWILWKVHGFWKKSKRLTWQRLLTSIQVFQPSTLRPLQVPAYFTGVKPSSLCRPTEDLWVTHNSNMTKPMSTKFCENVGCTILNHNVWAAQVLLVIQGLCSHKGTF